MIYAIRGERETSEKVFNRFKKQGHGFKLAVKVRKNRYFAKKPTKRLQRLSALKRESYRTERRKNIFFA